MLKHVLCGSRHLLAITLLVTLVCLTGCSTERKHSEETKAKKVWSGRSFADRTRIDVSPAASMEAAAFDSERAWSGFDDWEPAIAADPSSSYVYQMTTRYNGPAACNGCPFPVIVFRRSSDGGATWGADSFLFKTKKKQNDPQIEVASDGTIYAVWLDEYNPGIKFLKSTNRGSTWSTPIAFTGKGTKPGWSDKPILAISSNGQHVYIGFNSSDAWVVSSHDFGVTFSAPVKTSNDTRYWFHTGGAVANNGDVYFGAVDYSQDYTGPSNINVIRSTNAGSTWSTIRVDTSAEMPDCPADGCYFGFYGPTAGLAIDSAGRILLAYNAGDSANAPQRMYVRNSVNGVNWSARQEISIASGANSAFGAVSNGPTAGDFRVVWQDDSAGSNTAWNTWYRSTSNGGTSWSAPVRLSNLGSGAPYKTSAGYGFPYGDYLEIDVDSTGRNHYIWGEGSSYTGPGGTWFTRGQ